MPSSDNRNSRQDADHEVFGGEF